MEPLGTGSCNLFVTSPVKVKEICVEVVAVGA
jgi:hypothetical protein